MNNSMEQFIHDPIPLSRSSYLIGKLLSSAEKFPETSSLSSSLRRDWDLSGKIISFLQVTDGAYLIKFEAVSDLAKVCDGGPWSYDGDLFLVHHFNHEEGMVDQLRRLTKAQLWVQFHGLRPEYLSTSSGCALATRIGELVAFAADSEAEPVLEFLRVRVRVDVTKPLVPSLPVVLEDGSCDVVTAKYERLPRFCQLCRVLGHELESCHEKEEEPKEKIDDEHVQSDLMVMHTSATRISSNSVDAMVQPASGSRQGIIHKNSSCSLLKNFLLKMNIRWNDSGDIQRASRKQTAITNNNAAKQDDQELAMEYELDNRRAIPRTSSHISLGYDMPFYSDDTGPTVVSKREIKIRACMPVPKAWRKVMQSLARLEGVESICVCANESVTVISSGIDLVTVLVALRKGAADAVVLAAVNRAMNFQMPNSPVRFENAAAKIINAACLGPELLL